MTVQGNEKQRENCFKTGPAPPKGQTLMRYNSNEEWIPATYVIPILIKIASLSAYC